MDLLDEAITFAVETFAGKQRKGRAMPAILHSLEACTIAATMSEDQEILAAAVLHDIIEDTDVMPAHLESRFGKRVVELVVSETEEKRRDKPAISTWKARKTESINLLRKTNDMGIKIIFLSDKLSNMRSFNNDLKLLGPKLWNHFNQKDPEEHHWYYRSIADATKELEKYSAWQEYDELIKEVFNEERVE